MASEQSGFSAGVWAELANQADGGIAAAGANTPAQAVSDLFCGQEEARRKINKNLQTIIVLVSNNKTFRRPLEENFAGACPEYQL